MKVQVQLFAAAKDAVGQATLDVALPAGAKVADLRSQMLQDSPGLRPMDSTLLFAVNNEYASDEQVLHESDEVACFPPVSGG